MDLTKLSDADLDALESGDYSKLSDGALDALDGGSTKQALNEQHPDVGTARRALIKGFGANGRGIEYLREQLPNHEITENEDGEMWIRSPEEVRANAPRKVLDPSGAADWPKDVLEFAPDLIPTLAEGALGVIGKLPVAMGPAMGIGAAIGGGSEAARQFLGAGLGLGPKNFSPSEIGMSAAIGGAAPIMFGVGANKKSLNAAAAKYGKVAEDLARSGRGAIGRTYDQVTENAFPWLAGKVSGIPKVTLQNLRKYMGEVKELDAGGFKGETEFLDKVIGGTKNTIKQKSKAAYAGPEALLQYLDRDEAARAGLEFGDYLTDLRTYANEDIVTKELTKGKSARKGAKAQYKETLRLLRTADKDVPLGDQAGALARKPLVQPLYDTLDELKNEALESGSEEAIKAAIKARESVKALVGTSDRVSLKGAASLKDPLKGEFNLFKNKSTATSTAFEKRLKASAAKTIQNIDAALEGQVPALKNARELWAKRVQDLEKLDKVMPDPKEFDPNPFQTFADAARGPYSQKQIQEVDNVWKTEAKKGFDIADVYSRFGKDYTQFLPSSHGRLAGGLVVGAAAGGAAAGLDQVTGGNTPNWPLILAAGAAGSSLSSPAMLKQGAKAANATDAFGKFLSRKFLSPGGVTSAWSAMQNREKEKEVK